MRTSRRLLNLVTVVFLVSMLAPMIGMTTAQEATPDAPPVEEAALPEAPATEPAVLPTEPPPSPTEAPAVEGSTLEPAVPPAPPSDETPVPTEEPPSPPDPAPASAPAQTGAESRMAPATVDPTLAFQATTNDGGNPEGVYVHVLTGNGGPSPSVTLDASGAASLPLPFGSYSYRTEDPNGIYHEVIGSVTFSTDGQVVGLSLETYASHGTVQFVATTSDGGAATQSAVSITNQDTGYWYPVRSFGPDNTVSIPRLPYGSYHYEISPAGIYGGASGLFVVDDPTETIPVSLDALPGGTVTLTVLNDATSDPIPGASVVVSRWDEASGATIFEAEGTTGQDGRFTTIDSLPPGTHTIQISAEGFRGYTASVGMGGSYEDTIRLAPLVPGVLTVTVTNVDTSEPVGGASVIVQRSPDWVEVATGTTNPDGTFVTPGELAEDTYSVQVTADGYRWAARYVDVSGPTTLDIPIDPVRPGYLTVTVLQQESETPIPGASVTVRSTSTNAVVATGTTDDNGAYTTDDLLPYGEYAIDVTATGHFPQTGWIPMDGDGSIVITLEPQVAGTLTVTVTNADSGDPVPSATVSVRNSDGLTVFHQQTGASGVLTTQTLAGGSYSVQVSAANYGAISTMAWVKGDTSVPVSLEPRVPGVLTIHVVDSGSGDPIPGASVRIETTNTYQIVAAGTATDGTYMTPSPIRGGEYSITVTADDYFTGSVYPYPVVKGETEVTVELDPRIAGKLTVTAIDESTSAPIAGASVSITSYEGVAVEGVTDSSGVFVTGDELPGGYYEVTVRADGYFERTQSSILVQGPVETTISLSPSHPGILTVHVVNSRTSEPVANATVTLTRTDTQAQVGGGTTDAAGVFAVEAPLPAGDYSISTSREGYFEASWHWVRVNGATETTVSLSPVIDGELTLRIVNAYTGEPIAGATVRLAGGAVYTSQELVTDDQGYVRAVLSGGNYHVDGIAPGYYDLWTWDRVDVSGTTSATIELVPRIPGTLTLTVVDVITGQPVPGARVEVSDRDVLDGHVGTTDGQGIVATDELTGSSYNVRVTADGYFDGYQTITVEGPTWQVLTLEPRVAGNLTITVIDSATGAPIPGANISAYDESVWADPLTGVTDGNGVLALGEVRGARYVVYVETASGSTAHSVQVIGDTSVILEHPVMEPDEDGTVSVRVTDEDTGLPVSGATVSIRQLSQTLVVGLTGEEGTYTTSQPLAGGGVQITISSDGYYAGYVTATVNGSVSIDVSLTPQVDGALTINVFEQSSEIRVPYSGLATITITSRDTGEAIIASYDGSGTFRTENSLPGGPYDIEMTADGYRTMWTYVDVVGDTSIDVTMYAVPEPKDRTIMVAERITFAPIQGATVTIRSGDPQGALIFTGTTDEHGEVLVEALTNEDVVVTVEADGYFTTEFHSSQWGMPLIEMRRIETPRTVDLHVVDSVTGQGVENATVESVYCIEASLCEVIARGVTGEDGRVSLTVYPGVFILDVTAEGYAPIPFWARPQVNAVFGDAAAEITLIPASVGYGAPATLAVFPTVDGTWSLALANGQTRTGTITAGQADLGDVPLGIGHRLTVTGDGYEPVTLRFSVEEIYKFGVPASVHLEATLSIASTTTPTATVTVTPEPSQTATVTPEPSATVTVTVTPEPSVTITPVASETATVTVTPDATSTPEATTTPAATVTPLPSETATVTPEPTSEAPMQTSFILCGNEECTPPHNTGADGFTASWTVTEDTQALIDASTLASTGPVIGEPISLAVLQQDAPRSWTITAVIQGGVATGSSQPIPVGFYRVCLNPVLTGPDGSTIVLAGQPACEAVRLTVDGPVPVEGGEEVAAVPFSVVLTGAPEIIPPTNPGTGQDDPAGDPSPTAPATRGEPGSPDGKELASSSVTGLPKTGTGAAPTSIAGWIAGLGAAALLLAALGVRDRPRR